MKISKLVSAIASSLALVVGSLTAMPVAANAAAAVPAMYNMNIANQSSQGDAREFVTANGVTYFTVNTVDKGRTIWSLAGTPGATPQLVADVAQGAVFGSPSDISVSGNYLFFWDDTTPNWDGSSPYVVNLTTKVVTELVATDDSSLRSEFWSGSSKFVTSGNKVYFFAQSNRDSDSRLRAWTIGSANGKTEIIDDLNFEPAGIQEVDGNLWITTANSGWNMCDNTIKIFNPGTSTWGVVSDSSSNPITCVGSQGIFNYNGGQVAGLMVKVGGAWTGYTADANGVATRLGTWTTPYGGSFINMGANLYIRSEPNWGSDYHFYKISPTDGELVDQNALMFPTATSVRVTSMAYAGGYLYFAGNLNRTGKEQLYMWDGANPAVQMGTYEPLGRSLYFAEFNAAGGWSRNESVGTVGNSSIMNLALDDAVSYEPYLLNPDGTVTLVKNFNTGSEGSSPDVYCSGSTASSDLLVANLPLLDSNWGKDVIVEATSDGTNLTYKVLDVGTLYNICGFVASGSDTYFSAETDADGQGLYKMSSNHTITRLGNMTNPVRDGIAKIVNNKYYYFSDDYADLWVYDLATNTDSQLTGTNSSIVEYDSIDQLFFSGNYAVFQSRLKSDNYDAVFTVDLAAATYTENVIVTDVNAVDHNPDRLAIIGNTVYYVDVTDWNAGEGEKLYKAPITGGNATLVADVSAEPGSVDYVYAVGADIYVSYYNDTTRLLELKRFVGGTTLTQVTLPAGAVPECVTPYRGALLIAGGSTKELFTVSGATVTPMGVTVPDVWRLCDSYVTPRGMYMRGAEYGYTNGGPFDDELVYFGTLIPVAVERLGVAVSEGPAGIAGVSPSADPVTPGSVSGLTATAGNGAINLSWTAPTTGTTPRYLVTSTPAGAVCSITGTTASCIGTPGTSYTFTVKAGNEAGLSAGVTSSAVTFGSSAVVNTDDPNLASVTESKTVKAASGSVTFPDGSGFDVDSKGRIFAKIKSTYLTSTSGTIVVNYKVGSANKVYTCKVKAFGSLKKLAKAPTKGIVSKSKQACQLPAAAVTALKTKSIVIKATMSVKRFWATTVKAKTPAGKVLKVQARKMTVTMGKGA